MTIEVKVIVYVSDGPRTERSSKYRRLSEEHKVAEHTVKTLAGEAFRDCAYAGAFYNPKDR